MRAMLHLIVLGFFVGLGLAMSVGPVTLLIIRVNLAHGFWNGMMIGLGAVCGDFTYLILLTTGSLLIINQPTVLKIVGVLGAIILFYFGPEWPVPSQWWQPKIIMLCTILVAVFFSESLPGY